MMNMCVLSPSGFKTQGEAVPVWRGGESEALERLNIHLDRKVNPKKHWKLVKIFNRSVICRHVMIDPVPNSI